MVELDPIKHGDLKELGKMEFYNQGFGIFNSILILIPMTGYWKLGINRIGQIAETYTYQNRLRTSKSYLGFTQSTEYYPNNSSLVKKVTAVDGTSKSIIMMGYYAQKR